MIKTIEQAVNEELKYIEGRKSGEITSVKCQYDAINKVYMDGFEWGWIVSIAGLSGSGKTAFLNDLEIGFLDHNKDVSILSFNFEMLARRLIGRKISSLQHLSVKDLYSAEHQLTDSQLKRIKEETIPKILKYDITYVELRQTVPEIVKVVEDFIKSRPGKGIIVTLDHSLLLKRVNNADERNTLIELTSAFNDLKKKYPKLLFFILNQLNRTIEEDDRIANPKLHFPRKKDIFGSDSIYQISDAVMVIHRPEMLGIQYYGPAQLITKDVVFLHHLKVRDGEPVINKFRNNLKYNNLIWEG